MKAEDMNRKQREYRNRIGNVVTKRYERTKKGKLMRIYRNMKSRIDGVQKAKFHLYEGKYLLPKEEFYEWAMGCSDFHVLFDAWAESNYMRGNAPSVDRVDSTKGYEVSNMEWITHSENSRRGSISQWATRKAKEA